MFRKAMIAFAIVIQLLLLSAAPLHANPALGRSPEAGGSALERLASEAEPVTFALLDDKVEPDGRWVQTFRVHINPGGTLADISELVYGDARHIDEIFAALKKEHAELRSPAQVPANLEAEVSFDASVAFVPREITVDAGRGATVFVYYNGARRAVYDPKLVSDHKGLSAVVDLPADRPARHFSILEGDALVKVPAGTRVAYYEYRSDDDLERVVAEIYGTDSTRAIQDLLTRSDWDPNRWPPAPLAREQRLVIPLDQDFADDQFSALDVMSGNPAAGERLQAQLIERAKNGVYPVRRQSFGTVYHVVVRDFNLTARQISTLLYGNDAQYLAIAALAGFGTLHDLMQNQPQDVRLFGRTFDVPVDYELEQFPARDTSADASGKRTTLLLNGTTIYEWPLGPKKDGLRRQIDLPSGYRKLLYRPHTVTLLASQIAYALVSLGGSSNPQVRKDAEGRFVSQFIWGYGPSVPREDGYVFDYGRLVEEQLPDGKTTDLLIEVAVHPDTMAVAGAEPLYRTVLGNPFLLGVVSVLSALVVLGLFGFVARRA